jgi:hypothetical protein
MFAVAQRRDLNEADIYEEVIPGNFKKTVHLYIDCSSSISGPDMEEEKHVLVQVSETLMALNCRFSISTFPGHCLKTPLDEFSVPLKNDISGLSPHGGTPLEEVFLKDKSMVQYGDVVVVLTDGGPDNDCKDMAKILKGMQCPTLTVGVGVKPSKPPADRSVEIDSSTKFPDILYRFLRDIARA